MHETCKSCGTVFEVNGSVLTNDIKWFKCGVCDKKWAFSSTKKDNLLENRNKTEKVQQELASIKSIVEGKSKILAKKPNPVLDQKNKTVAEIASELSLSKLNENNKNKIIKNEKVNDKKKNDKFNTLPFFIIALSLTFFLVILFRSTLLSYSFVYFPNHTQSYFKKINSSQCREIRQWEPLPKFVCG